MQNTQLGPIMQLLRLLTAWACVLCCCTGELLDLDRDGLPDDYEMQLAEAFAPHVYFHPDETYYPISAETFVNASTLLYHGSLYRGECVVESEGYFTAATLPSLHPPGPGCVPPIPAHMPKKMLRGASVAPVSEADTTGGGCSGAQTLVCVDAPELQEVQCSDRNYQEYVFSEYSDVAYDGTKGFSLELGPHNVNLLAQRRPAALRDTPVYVHVFPTPVERRNYGVDTVTIQYWFLYPFSGQADSTLQAGQHEGDWEHVSLVVHNNTHAIVNAYFAAHSHESSWLTAPDYEVEDGHVRVFVARNTHANYPSIGRKSRLGGLFSDECSSEGYLWKPDFFINMGEKEFPLPQTRWMRYNGFWGSSRRHYDGKLPFPTGFPPRTPCDQVDYWDKN